MAKRNLPLGGAVPMEPGERDRSVLIEERPEADTADTDGSPIDGPWTTLTTVWMRKLDLKMAERFVSNQESAALDTQWEMGYREDMDPETVDVPKLRRLVYGGRTYDIISASQIGRREGIELMTLAKSAGD